MRWMCIFVASVALAQTPPPTTPVAQKPAQAPPAAEKSAQIPPAAEKPAQAPSAAELMRASIEKQRAAVRQQAQAAGAALIPWSPWPAPSIDAPEPACDPIATDIVTPLIENAAKANDLNTSLVRAVIEQESAYRPCAVSHKGARGLMQLMPDTAGELNVAVSRNLQRRSFLLGY